MLSVRNEFETVPAFETIAGSSIGVSSDRETTAEMIEAVETTTSIHKLSTDRFWQELARLSDDNSGEMYEIQEECADLLNESMPMPEFCSVTLEDNEWRVIPEIDDYLTRVSDIPEEYSEDYLLLVNDHGNVTCLEWNNNTREYQSIWDMV